MVSILVVEDHECDLRRCVDLIKQIDPSVHIYTAKYGFEALKILTQEKIDALFLDIELPDYNGFDLARDIRNIKSKYMLPILFVTATDEHNIDTFEKYNHHHYIVKEYTDKTFIDIVKPLIEGLNATPEEERVVAFKTDSCIITLKFNEIMYVSYEDDYPTIHTLNNSRKLFGYTLENVIKAIGNPIFVKCHKSFAVNVSKVAKLDKDFGKSKKIYFRDGFTGKCPVGTSYQKKITKMIRSLGNNG